MPAPLRVSLRCPLPSAFMTLDLAAALRRRSSARRATRPEFSLGIVRRQPPLPAAVGVHDVNVARQAIRQDDDGREGDLLTIGRPAHPRKSGGQPSLPTPVGVHDPENAGIARVGRLADEGDLRTRRCGGKARPYGERRGRCLGLRAATQESEDRYSDERHERHDCGVPAPSPLPPLPRLLDQRLDKGVELPMRDGIARAVWSRWGGDGHNFLRSPIELVLLGP